VRDAQASGCRVPAADAVGALRLVTCECAMAPGRREVVLAYPGGGFPACGLCGEAASCCVLCRAVGHFGTVCYLQRGMAFSLCTPCAAHLTTFDYDSRETCSTGL
jgi:hypothetical protein